LTNGSRFAILYLNLKEGQKLYNIGHTVFDDKNQFIAKFDTRDLALHYICLNNSAKEALDILNDLRSKGIGDEEIFAAIISLEALNLK